MYPVLGYFTAHREKQEHFQGQSLFLVAIWSAYVSAVSIDLCVKSM